MFFRTFERIKYFFFHVQNDWEIGYINLPIDQLIGVTKRPKVTWFKMPREVFWADPFGVQIDGKYYIFYEEFLYKSNYGRISCKILNQDFQELKTSTVIDEKIHFSFPQIIIHDGEYYMLPETCEKKRLSLYKSTDFPLEWKEHKVILAEPCVDSLLFYRNNNWYLFYSKSCNEHTLFLRTSSDLDSNWSNSTEIVISKDPSYARNGGQIIENDKGIFRISQNCKNLYGEKIGIHQIKNLSFENYQEELINELSLKSSTVSCCHTLNPCGNITLIDRRRERLFLKSRKELMSSIFMKYKL